MNQFHLNISVSQQSLEIRQNNNTIKLFSISSATNGIGSQEGSYCTPIGNFIISEKHGYNAPSCTIFKSRQPQGVWQGEQGCGDLVLSRILWLQGTDSHNLNSKERYIYIHGTNHEDLIGFPHSCGCIRMKNTDVIELYDLIDINTRVLIRED